MRGGFLIRAAAGEKKRTLKGPWGEGVKREAGSQSKERVVPGVHAGGSQMGSDKNRLFPSAPVSGRRNAKGGKIALRGASSLRGDRREGRTSELVQA